MMKDLRKVKGLMKKVWLLAFFLFLAKDCMAASIMQQMDVRIGIFDAAHIVFNYNNDNARYAIGATVRTANFFNSLYPFSATYESKGSLTENKLKPEVYQTQSKTRNHVRGKTIFYNKDGIAYKKKTFKDKKNKETAILGVSKTADAGDMQTIFAILIQQFASQNTCSLVREVHDGKKHYKVHATDNGLQKRYFDYLQKEEKAHLCTIFIENLADNNDNVLWEVSAEKPIKMWVKKDDKTQMPFILEIGIDSTPLGALRATPVINEKK